MGETPKSSHGPIPLERLDEVTWRIPRSSPMNTHGLVFATEQAMSKLKGDPCLEQVRNVAMLPGIVGPSIGMPDIHWGYGFPIGGVAAFDLDEGVISPGGVGYDINCGVRLLITPLLRREVHGQLRALVEGLFRTIPTGLGSRQNRLVLDRRETQAMVTQGAAWSISRGFGQEEDLARIEAGGQIPGASFESVSERAYTRGRNQLGNAVLVGHLRMDSIRCFCAHVFD